MTRNYWPLLTKFENGISYSKITLRKITNLPVTDVKRFTNHARLVETWDGKVWIVPHDPEKSAYETSPYKINSDKKRSISGPKNRLTG